MARPSLAIARCSGGFTAYPTNAAPAIVASAVDKQFMHIPSNYCVAASTPARMSSFGGGADQLGKTFQSQ